MRHSWPRLSAPPSSVETFRGYRLAAAVFAAASGVLAWPWLSGAVTIPYDAKAEFYPQFAFLARSLAAGQSPFWNPNIFDGSPQIADPQSLIFAPTFLLAALLGPSPSFVLADALVFGSLAAGGLAILLFFRDRGWHPAAALVAALAFAYGGSAAWRIQHVGQILSLTWCPWTIWALARAIDRGSVPWGALAGFFGALLLLGRDQVAMLEAYLLGAFTVERALRGPLRRAMPPIAAGLGVGIAVCAIPLAMTAVFAQQSNRPEIGLLEAFKGSLHPGSFLTLVSANLFGVAGPLADYWGPPSPAWSETGLYIARNMATLYMGALPVLALSTLVVTKPRALWDDREARFFSFATLVLGLFALGQYTPVFAVLYEIPGIDLFRRPADATFPLCFCLAMLGGFAVDRFLRDRLHRIGAAIIVFGLIALCAMTAVAKARVPEALLPLGSALFFLAASGCILAILPRRNIRAAVLVVGVLLTADLAWNNAPNESTGLPPQTFAMLRPDTRDPTMIALNQHVRENTGPDRRDRIEIAGLGFMWPNSSMVQGLDNHLGYNPIRLSLFEDFTGAGDHVALPEQRVFSKAFPSYASTAAALAGLRFIATGVPVEQIDPTLRSGDLTWLGKTGDAFLYENTRALPRVLLATRAIQTDLTGLIRTGDWPAVDYATTVLLEAPVDPDRPRRPGVATLLRYENTSIKVEAEAPDGGWLVLNDVWHPWWRVTVDGAPRAVLRANGMFRAVAIPPGTHQIVFSFHPLEGLWQDLRSMVAGDTSVPDRTDFKSPQ